MHNEKVNLFRENRAAKTIQRHWTTHQFKKHEHEREEVCMMMCHVGLALHVVVLKSSELAACATVFCLS